MDPTILWQRYPRLYHMAEAGSWMQIKQHGLLSTISLLDLFEVQDSERTEIVNVIRDQCISIQHPTLGSAIVRDQCPMYDSGLRKCLEDGLTPLDWLTKLNERVFFWVTEERLHRLLCAANYASKVHDVITLDTKSVVESHLAQIELCPMNSGCTRPFPHPRGKNTFLPVSNYPWETWKKKRGRSGETVVELTVLGGVTDIQKHVVSVNQMRGRAVLGSVL